jgi:putative transposase
MSTTRRVSFNESGHAHFLTFSCFRRAQLLADEQASCLLAESVNRARDQHSFDLWAYVFMPDHVHMLIRPRCETYAIAAIFKSIKGPFAKRLIAEWKVRHPPRLRRLELSSENGVTHRVWQRGGGYGRNLFTRDLIRRAIDYVEFNPVRKGLAANPADWRWSSASARGGYGDTDLRIDQVNWELVDNVSRL